MLTVYEKHNGYEIEFPYNPHLIEKVKAIPGRSFNYLKKSWTIPFSQKDELERLKKQYGVNENVAVKAPEQVIAPAEMPDLNIEIPLKRPLFPFQGKGVSQGLIYKRFINGDQPGLGKTTQGVATVIAADHYKDSGPIMIGNTEVNTLPSFPVLVICPSTLKENWKREWEIVAGVKAMILNDSVKTTWDKYYNAGIAKVFIVNYESLKKYFVVGIDKNKYGSFKLKNVRFNEKINMFNTVIVDELHKCKDGTTQQSKFVMGIARGKNYVIGLTGTPVVNKPKDLISQLFIIDRLNDVTGIDDTKSSYKFFMERYCGGNGQGAFNLKELNSKLSNVCFFQRQKKEVLKELPDKMRQIILSDITTRKEYNEAISDLANYLKEFRKKTEIEVQKSMMGEVMVRIGVCKNISARGKLNEIFEYIDEVTESGEKVVVFIHQKEIAVKILERYPQSVSVRGDDSMEQRQNSIDKFQNNSKTNIIVCSIKAAGVGITLTASSRVAFVELPWHPADCDQCEDRCHRIGQKDSVQVTYFLGKDTIDERIYEIIEEKRKISDTITGTTDSVQREIIEKLFNLFNI